MYFKFCIIITPFTQSCMDASKVLTFHAAIINPFEVTWCVKELLMNLGVFLNKSYIVGSVDTAFFIFLSSQN